MHAWLVAGFGEPSPIIAFMHCHLVGGESPISTISSYRYWDPLVAFTFEAQASIHEALDLFSRIFQVTKVVFPMYFFLYGVEDVNFSNFPLPTLLLNWSHCLC